jgi:hypothetical protein
MIEIPSDVLDRCDEYCRTHGVFAHDLRGFGVDAFIWQTAGDKVVKVFRREGPYGRERDVYLRLRQRS